MWRLDMKLLTWFKSLFVKKYIPPSRHYKRWTEQETLILKEELKDGKSTNHIAYLLGRSERSVKRIIRVLEL